MSQECLNTYFAPAERTPENKLKEQVDMFCNTTLLSEVADALPNLMMVLNKEREVIYANERICEVLKISGVEQIAGKRPGEVFDCAYSHLMDAGCGTSEHCQVCGAVLSILAALDGKQSVRECHLRTSANDAYTMQVWSTPFEFKGERYAIFILLDISDTKWRESLERMFFHDLINSIGSITGLAEVLKMEAGSNAPSETIQMIQRASDHLIEEVESQRQLSAAERGEITLMIIEHSSHGLLMDIIEMYANHEVSKGKKIVLEANAESAYFKTDAALFRRVVGNMVKNALEAIPEGEIVTLDCRKDNGRLIFSVHNPGVMPKDAQLQMFQRAFSSKGSGRGIGSYSMKLFGEKFLNGEVSFESNEENGTVFYFKVPVE